jgi:hypothetical protein
MQRSVNLILEIGKMKTKSAQNTNEFNCVDSMVSLIWTPVVSGIPVLAAYKDVTIVSLIGNDNTIFRSGSYESETMESFFGYLPVILSLWNLFSPSGEGNSTE